MHRQIQVTAIILVAVAMALSLAHALELPGKMRLGKEAYISTQKIYYPGFTIGGVAEPLGILVLLILLLLGPSAGPHFWWTAAACLALAVSHGIYWFVTHPVNNFWTKDIQLTRFAAAFFSMFAPEIADDWSKLRDTWEYSHVARAVFAMLSLVCLSIAVTA